MVCNRTTTSCVLLVAALLVRAAMADAIAAQAARSPQPAPKIFPSDPIWTVDISAKPVAAPVASGDRLFIALESAISARQLTDGAEIWNRKIAVIGPMAVSDDRLIVASKGEVSGLATSDGTVVWTQNVGDLTAPPAVHGDTLLLATAKQLSAHRVADGTQAWAREVGVVEQRPTVGAGRVYVPVSDGKLVAMDLATGEVLWERDVGIKPTEPLVYDDRVFFGSAAKKFCSFRLTGTEAWCTTIGAVVIGAAVTDGEHVYLVALDNVLYALDRHNGARRWKKDLGSRPSTGPTLVGKTVSAPGREAGLQAYDTAKGDKGPRLTLPATMVEVPVFIPATDGGLVKVAALHGGLENVWKLTLAWPAPPQLPAVQVAPLTELPGQAVPIEIPRAPPG